MTDKLTEIRERHEKVYTTAKREGYYHDIDPEDAHDDRGYLLDRITELETENTRLRTANTELNEWNKGIEAQLDKVRDAFNIPDWQDCVNAIKAALEDEVVNTDT